MGSVGEAVKFISSYSGKTDESADNFNIRDTLRNGMYLQYFLNIKIKLQIKE